MTGLRRLFVIGTVTLLAGLVVTFPARLAYQWLAPPAVVLAGISGTVWHGRAAEATVGGIYLSDLVWRFKPFSLFAGRLKYNVSALPPGGSLQADVAVAPGGTAHLSDVRASLPVASLGPVIAIAGIDGSVDLQLQDLVVADGRPREVRGNVAISGLLVRALSNEPLGDYRADFSTGDGMIAGEIADQSGILDVTGTIELRQDGNYSLIGQVAPQPNAPSQIVEQLQYLGSADAQGRRGFRFEGRL